MRDGKNQLAEKKKGLLSRRTSELLIFRSPIIVRIAAGSQTNLKPYYRKQCHISRAIIGDKADFAYMLLVLRRHRSVW